MQQRHKKGPKVTVYPPKRPAPPPEPRERARTPAPAKLSPRRCASGQACPAVGEIGRPEKLAGGNKEEFCFRCRRRLADEMTADLDARRRGGAPRIDGA